MYLILLYRDNMELKSRVGTQEKELKNREKKVQEYEATNQTLTVTVTSLQSELKTSNKDVKR